MYSVANLYNDYDEFACFPFYSGQVWKDWTVIEDSPEGERDVWVEKRGDGYYAKCRMSKAVLVPSYWLSE